MWILIVLIVLAVLGILGTVLKAVLLVIGAIVLAVVVAGWLGWRALKREVRAAERRSMPADPSTTIIIGETQRSPDDPAGPGQLPSGRDDRY